MQILCKGYGDMRYSFKQKRPNEGDVIFCYHSNSTGIGNVCEYHDDMYDGLKYFYWERYDDMIDSLMQKDLYNENNDLYVPDTAYLSDRYGVEYAKRVIECILSD